MDAAVIKKRLEYEKVKARIKELEALKNCGICGADKAKACQGCGTTAYCSTACQRIDWRDRGHRKACKKIQAERAAEAARAEAARAEAARAEAALATPTPPPAPPPEVFYGPAPRSHADEVRARIAAEHEAARARREANPAPKPLSARFGSRCPICFEDWDVNADFHGDWSLYACCCRKICDSCSEKTGEEPCPFCRAPHPSIPDFLTLLRRHVENEVPEAIAFLGNLYLEGKYGLVQSAKKAAKLYKRAVELGDVDATNHLGWMYKHGNGVKLDKKKAERLFRMAADRGHAPAQFNLWELLESDDEEEEGLPYLERAAALEFTQAESALGVEHRFLGPVVQHDLGKAKHWLARAAAKGDEVAIRLLENIDDQEQFDEREQAAERAAAELLRELDGA
ncbi:hypothetical protein AURANDRAFT_37702 [Aureococcus anophagefferens]|uniref:MYND-type domain-containing protein n=1 Tax=Aureococcus anophagefferens TaxID=44056 RepID=F0YAV1_AURAN|nr:hypothetical protein AURANDRAFT_37702 [Aureococcus anophagefferens]EGB07597.1 hypothetical protein AURANDRAFT_37702 [Aureococcus anophagefferens]|eukprot:XP_009037597.1 hypothetical protein AURANDRAFT_37702 [Aureococcus anophagefferens]